MSTSRTIAKNSAFLYFRMLVVLAVSLYTVRVVLQALGVVDFGIYGVAGGIVAMFAFLNNTMSSAAQRFLGFDIGRKDDVALGKTFNAVVVLHVAIALAVVLAGESVGLWLINHQLDIPRSRLPAANAVLHWSVAATAALVLRTPYIALVIARQKMWFFSMTSVLESLLKLGIAFAITQTRLDRLEVYAALVCAVSWLMLIGFVFFCRVQFGESRLTVHRDRRVYGALTAFIGWSFIGNLAGVLRNQGVNVLLNLFFGPALNAAHGVMTQAQSAVAQFTSSFHTALSPQIYQSYAQGDYRRMHAMVYTGAKLNFLLLAVLVAPALYGMDFLLELWLGTPPAYAGIFVKLALVASLIEAVSQPLVTAASATGNIKSYQLAVGGTLLLNVPLSYLAFRYAGSPVSFLYVAIAIQFLCFALRVWFLRRMIDLRVGAFLREVVAPLVLTSGIGAAVLFLVGLWLGPPKNMSQFSLGGGLLLACTALSTFFVGLNVKERNIVMQPIRSRLYRAIRRARAKVGQFMLPRYRRRVAVAASPQAVVGRFDTELAMSMHEFAYKDETWWPVVHLELMCLRSFLRLPVRAIDNECINGKVKVDASGRQAEFRSEHRRNDWIYLVARAALPERYAVSCSVLLRRVITEFQIAFRHVDIANRVRFRVVDNRTLDFDIIHNGIFMHKLATVPFSFEIGRSHDISVVVDKTRYAFFCDSLPILEVSNGNPASQTGGMAIILWDNSGDSKIDAAVSNFRVAV